MARIWKINIIISFVLIASLRISLAQVGGGSPLYVLKKPTGTSIYMATTIFNSDSTLFAIAGSGSGYNGISIFETKSGKKLNSFEASNHIKDVAFDSQGKILTSLSCDDNNCFIENYDISTGKIANSIFALSFLNWNWSMALSHNGNALAYKQNEFPTGGMTIYIVDLNTKSKSLLSKIKTDRRSLNSQIIGSWESQMAFGTDGNKLAFTCCSAIIGVNKCKDPMIEVWQVQPPKLLGAIPLNNDLSVQTMLFGGNRFAYTDVTNVYIYDIPSMQMIYHKKTRFASISYDGKLTSGREDNDKKWLLNVYNISAGEVLVKSWEFPRGITKPAIVRILFSPDSKYLLTTDTSHQVIVYSISP